MTKWEIIHNYSRHCEQLCESLVTFESSFDDAVRIVYAFCDWCGIDSDDVVVDREHNEAYGEYQDECVMLVEVKTEE